MSPETKRIPVYMMHPLGDGANRERNRKLACLWQAEIQRAHPEWLVLAPWIGLSGAWGEDLRELGMTVDFATIDICAAGVVAGVLDGPKHFINGGQEIRGVSPGMSEELVYMSGQKKPIYDVRERFKVELPVNWFPPRIALPATEFKPRFKKFQEVLVENKPGGVCRVKDIEETAAGVYRYLVERTETFFAHEQAIAHLNPGVGHKI